THTTRPPTSTLSLHDALPISIFQAALFESGGRVVGRLSAMAGQNKSQKHHEDRHLTAGIHFRSSGAGAGGFSQTLMLRNLASERSEEHTSELQSRGHLVCRLR